MLLSHVSSPANLSCDQQILRISLSFNMKANIWRRYYVNLWDFISDRDENDAVYDMSKATTVTTFHFGS